MIPMPPLPIDAFLVPDPTLPLGFTSTRQPLTNGLPFTWSLDGDLSLVLHPPIGDAIAWRDADASAIASASADETAPHAAPRGSDPREQVALRLLLRKARSTIASLPLSAGLWRISPDGDGAASLVELYVVGWLIHAGCMRGQGDFGSYIEVGWRRIDRAGDAFDPDAFGIRRRGGYLP